MSMQYLDSELRFMWLLHALKPGGGQYLTNYDKKASLLACQLHGLSILALAFRHLRGCRFGGNTELINNLLALLPCDILFTSTYWLRTEWKETWYIESVICLDASNGRCIEQTMHRMNPSRAGMLLKCSLCTSIFVIHCQFYPFSLPGLRSVRDSPAGACLRISLQPLRGNMWSRFIRTRVYICFMERTTCSFSRWGTPHADIFVFM